MGRRAEHLHAVPSGSDHDAVPNDHRPDGHLVRRGGRLCFFERAGHPQDVRNGARSGQAHGRGIISGGVTV